MQASKGNHSVSALGALLHVAAALERGADCLYSFEKQPRNVAQVTQFQAELLAGKARPEIGGSSCRPTAKRQLPVVH